MARLVESPSNQVVNHRNALVRIKLAVKLAIHKLRRAFGSTYGANKVFAHAKGRDSRGRKMSMQLFPGIRWAGEIVPREGEWFLAGEFLAILPLNGAGRKILVGVCGGKTKEFTKTDYLRSKPFGR